MNIFWGEPEDILSSPELDGTEAGAESRSRRESVAFHHGLTVHLAPGPTRTDQDRARSTP